VDKSFEGESSEENRSAVIAKVPPPPRHPSITTFKEAKLAYANHRITAEEYRMIVDRLKKAYAKEVEQLKLDYRLGKMDKTEYARRAAHIKEKYK
jgi:hypothetical protein